LFVIGRFLNTVVVSAHGALNLSASEDLAGVLRDLIDGQGNLAVVVNLADVCGIDQSGADVLAAAANRIATRGGQLQLAGPTGTVVDSLVLAGLAGLITIPLSQTHRRASRT